MSSGIRVRSSRYLIKSLNFNSTTQNRIILNLNSSVRSSIEKKIPSSRPKFLSNSFSHTNRLRKSVESIKSKKQEVELEQNSFFAQKLKRLKSLVSIVRVEIQFRKAAAFIQRVFRGFLARKKYRPLLLEYVKDKLSEGIQVMNTKVTYIWTNMGIMKDSAILIQRNVKSYLTRKKFLALQKKIITLEKIKRNLSATRIQRWFRALTIKKAQKFTEKLKKIRENLSFIKFKYFWDRHKFAWKVMKKHYGLEDDKDSTGSVIEKIVVITPKMRKSFATKGKYSKKNKKPPRVKDKLKPKGQKSCLVTSNSACSGNPGSEKIAGSLVVPSLYKDDRTDSRLNTFENFSDNEMNAPLDKVKNMFKEINLDEDIGNELIESLIKY